MLLKIIKNDKNEIKEYINQQTLFKIIVNSESEVKIKSEFAKILSEISVFDMDYIGKGEYNTKDIEIEEETKIILKEYFNNIEERYENELILKIKPSIEICKIKSQEQKEYAIELNKK